MNQANLEKSMSLKANSLIDSEWRGKEKKWHIENEGITRDVIENKRTKFVQRPLPRDVDEK
ncbi:MAG: hypothetical protein ABSF71_09215 [Terriglobia bacterium]